MYLENEYFTPLGIARGHTVEVSTGVSKQEEPHSLPIHT
jgi:hypothetical protein